MQDTLKQQAESLLGTAIGGFEWDKAMAEAEGKLDRIIQREGDAGNERRKPFYLAQLIAETVRSIRLSCLADRATELNRYAAEMGLKKEQPV